MSVIREFFLLHRTGTMLLVFAALCMKIAVPTGFMIGQDSRVLTVQICEDSLGNHVAKQLVIPMTGGKNDSGSQQQGKAECPFASLSMASLAGANPALLALALAYILAVGFHAAPIQLPKRAFHLRPPLRGPPAQV